MPQTIALVVFENILRYSTGTDVPRAVLAAAFDEPTEVFSEILRPSWVKQSQMGWATNMGARANFGGKGQKANRDGFASQCLMVYKQSDICKLYDEHENEK